MSRFVKKPVEIEAEQYTEYGKVVKGMCNSTSCYVGGNNEPHVHTIHGSQVIYLEIGDFVIPEPDGVHFYPCKPDIFHETYDAVETDPTAKFLVIHVSNAYGKTFTCRTVEQLEQLITGYKADKKRKRDEDVDFTLGWGRMTEAEYGQVPECQYFKK